MATSVVQSIKWLQKFTPEVLLQSMTILIVTGNHVRLKLMSGWTLTLGIVINTRMAGDGAHKWGGVLQCSCHYAPVHQDLQTPYMPSCPQEDYQQICQLFQWLMWWSAACYRQHLDCMGHLDGASHLRPLPQHASPLDSNQWGWDLEHAQWGQCISQDFWLTHWGQPQVVPPSFLGLDQCNLEVLGDWNKREAQLG